MTEGIRAIKDIFLKHPNPNRLDDELFKSLFINLTRNDVQFNDKYYLQSKGTAMGKKFALANANIFMASGEK